MKKLLFLFSAICSVSLLWAAVGNTTTTSTYWKEADFNGTITPQQTSKVTTPDGFVSFEISGDKGVTYTASYHTVWASNKPRLSFGDLERHGYINGAITATPLQNGYTFVWTKLSTNTAACGAGGYFYLGHESETLLANAFGGTSSSSTKNFADYNDSVPFRFHRTGASIETSPAWMVRVDVEYQIFPNAPTWKDATDVMDVTVDNVNGQHYYNLANNIQVENPAFAGTVKYEIIGNNAQYVYWNGDHTAFYVLKPGTYTVKAYIEKVDGKYCSSAYTEELTINATT
ncbi:MAG: hypothetical protein MJZ64_08025, partial [Paludibacteraceae bacterium]|nr:hypothetical protein [Paludibacteraceae bacterium]